MNIETQYMDGLIEKESEAYTNRGILISYISPCMVIMAVALFLFFMQLNIKGKVTKFIISHLGKATFGVFILHVGAAFWYWTDFWKRFNVYADYTTVDMVLAVILTTLLIYFAASLISIGRIQLFKLLRIHKAVDFLADLPSFIKKKREEKQQLKGK